MSKHHSGSSPDIWLRNGQPVLVRECYNQDEIMDRAVASWKGREVNNIFIVSGARGYGKSYVLQYLTSKYFSKNEDPNMICLQYTATDCMSAVPLHGIRSLLCTFFMDLAKILRTKLGITQETGLSSLLKVSNLLVKLDTEPQSMTTFKARYNNYKTEKLNLKQDVEFIYKALDLALSTLFHYNTVLDVDFASQGQSNNSTFQTTTMISKLLETLQAKHEIKVAFVIDNLQFLDFSSWGFLNGFLKQCPRLFVAASTCLAEDYESHSSLMFITDLKANVSTKLLELDRLQLLEIKEILAFKLIKHRYELPENTLMSIVNKIFDITKGQIYHVSLVIEHLCSIIEGEMRDNSLDIVLNDTEAFQESALVLKTLGLFTEKASHRIKQISVLGDFCNLDLFAEILKTPLDSGDQSIETYDATMNYAFGEPLFVQQHNLDGYASQKISFRTQGAWHAIRASISDDEAQKIVSRAYLFYKKWSEYAEELNVEWRTFTIPLVLRYAQLQKQFDEFIASNSHIGGRHWFLIELDPRTKLSHLEKGFFYYSDQNSYPETLYYNSRLTAIIEEYSCLSRKLKRKTDWLEAASALQEMLHIFDHKQLVDYCIWQLKKSSIKIRTLSSVGWLIDFWHSSSSVFWIRKGLSLKPASRPSSIASKQAILGIHEKLMSHYLHSENFREYELELYHFIKVANDLRKSDKVFYIQALCMLTSYMCITNHSWSKVGFLQDKCEALKNILLSHTKSEALDDFHVTFASSCLELGFFEDSADLLKKLDVVAISARQTEKWYQHFSLNLNIAYLCIGNYGNRMYCANKSLEIGLKQFPVSWSICSSMTATSCCLAEFGNLKEAFSVADMAWQKYLTMEKMDTELNHSSDSNNIYPTLCIRDLLFVNTCRLGSTLKSPQDLGPIFDLVNRAASEWSEAETYYFSRYPLLVSELKIYTFLFFVVLFYDETHKTSHLRALRESVLPLFVEFLRFVDHKVKGHPLQEIMWLFLFATKSLYDGKLSFAEEYFLKILVCDEIVEFPFLGAIIQCRVKMLRLLAMDPRVNEPIPELSVLMKASGAQSHPGESPIHDGKLTPTFGRTGARFRGPEESFLGPIPLNMLKNLLDKYGLQSELHLLDICPKFGMAIALKKGVLFDPETLKRGDAKKAASSQPTSEGLSRKAGSKTRGPRHRLPQKIIKTTKSSQKNILASEEEFSKLKANLVIPELDDAGTILYSKKERGAVVEGFFDFDMERHSNARSHRRPHHHRHHRHHEGEEAGNAEEAKEGIAPGETSEQEHQSHHHHHHHHDKKSSSSDSPATYDATVKASSEPSESASKTPSPASDKAARLTAVAGKGSYDRNAMVKEMQDSANEAAKIVAEAHAQFTKLVDEMKVVGLPSKDVKAKEEATASAQKGVDSSKGTSNVASNAVPKKDRLDDFFGAVQDITPKATTEGDHPPKKAEGPSEPKKEKGPEALIQGPSTYAGAAKEKVHHKHISSSTHVNNISDHPEPVTKGTVPTKDANTHATAHPPTKKAPASIIMKRGKSTTSIPVHAQMAQTSRKRRPASVEAARKVVPVDAAMQMYLNARAKDDHPTMLLVENHNFHADRGRHWK